MASDRRARGRSGARRDHDCPQQARMARPASLHPRAVGRDPAVDGGTAGDGPRHPARRAARPGRVRAFEHRGVRWSAGQRDREAPARRTRRVAGRGAAAHRRRRAAVAERKAKAPRLVSGGSAVEGPGPDVPADTSNVSEVVHEGQENVCGGALPPWRVGGAVMSRRLVFFDCETTGPDPYEDRIVELAVRAQGKHPVVTRINPGRPIPPKASAIHGITDADVADAPRFEEIAADVQRMIDGHVLVGYNCIRFDTILLDAELRRAGQSGCIDFPEVDLYQVGLRSEPRTLAGAVKRFLGRDLEDAHTAAADTEVLSERSEERRVG